MKVDKGCVLETVNCYFFRARAHYLAERQDRKDMLIFDAGHASGDVHIYEYKESRSAKEIEEETKASLKVDKLPKMMNPVWMWVNQKFGHSISWKLTSE